MFGNTAMQQVDLELELILEIKRRLSIAYPEYEYRSGDEPVIQAVHVEVSCCIDAPGLIPAGSVTARPVKITLLPFQTHIKRDPTVKDIWDDCH